MISAKELSEKFKNEEMSLCYGLDYNECIKHSLNLTLKEAKIALAICKLYSNPDDIKKLKLTRLEKENILQFLDDFRHFINDNNSENKEAEARIYSNILRIVYDYGRSDEKSNKLICYLAQSSLSPLENYILKTLKKVIDTAENILPKKDIDVPLDFNAHNEDLHLSQEKSQLQEIQEFHKSNSITSDIEFKQNYSHDQLEELLTSKQNQLQELQEKLNERTFAHKLQTQKIIFTNNREIKNVLIKSEEIIKKLETELAFVKQQYADLRRKNTYDEKDIEAKKASYIQNLKDKMEKYKIKVGELAEEDVRLQDELDKVTFELKTINFEYETLSEQLFSIEGEIEFEKKLKQFKWERAAKVIQRYWRAFWKKNGKKILLLRERQEKIELRKKKQKK